MPEQEQCPYCKFNVRIEDGKLAWHGNAMGFDCMGVGRLSQKAIEERANPNAVNKLIDCVGCHNDVYNHCLGGAKECWHLKDAKMVLVKLVHFDQVPPYKNKPAMHPSCYKMKDYATIPVTSLDEEGYRK